MVVVLTKVLINTLVMSYIYDLPFRQLSAPILELHEFVVDLLNIDFSPRNIVVAADAVYDVIVQFVQLLEQIELFPYLRQFGVLCVRETEEFFAVLVSLQLTPHAIKAVLEDY